VGSYKTFFAGENDFLTASTITLGGLAGDFKGAGLGLLIVLAQWGICLSAVKRANFRVQ
jgi:hypothetical protein